MNRSHPSVHPIDEPPVNNQSGDENVVAVRMTDIPGKPGTPGTPSGLLIRVSQFIVVVVSLCIMASTHDIITTTTLRYTTAIVSFQSLWSLSFAIVYIYALLVGWSLRNTRIIFFIIIGDGIMFILMLFPFSLALGITTSIRYDLDNCVGPMSKVGVGDGHSLHQRGHRRTISSLESLVIVVE